MSEIRKAEIIQKILFSDVIVGKDAEEINRTKTVIFNLFCWDG